jgi:subtilisin-like proprotein convertase family protein
MVQNLEKTGEYSNLALNVAGGQFKNLGNVVVAVEMAADETSKRIQENDVVGIQASEQICESAGGNWRLEVLADGNCKLENSGIKFGIDEEGHHQLGEQIVSTHFTQPINRQIASLVVVLEDAN